MLVYYLEYRGYCVELPRGDTVVGRDVTCGLRFNDPAISRQHIRVRRDKGEVVIQDLGSSNGTRVNEAPLVGARPLADRDHIHLGSRVLVFRAIEEDSEVQPSTHKVTSFAVLAQLDATVRSHARTTPTNQRCPACGVDVAAAERVCHACGHDWGSVRPRATTLESIDRRSHQRFPVELHIIYRSSELELEVKTRDLSHSGVFLCSEVLEPIGTRCELTILVDGGPPVTLQGLVRRVVEHAKPGAEPVGLGIEFVDLGDTERSWLDIAVAHTLDTVPFERLDR